MSDTQRLGFIGLGNIGGGVSANLLADGHELTALDTALKTSSDALAASVTANTAVANKK